MQDILNEAQGSARFLPDNVTLIFGCEGGVNFPAVSLIAERGVKQSVQPDCMFSNSACIDTMLECMLGNYELRLGRSFWVALLTN